MDGQCPAGCPLLAVPLRGRRGRAVGCVLAARDRGRTPFTPDDALARDILATAAAVGMHWAAGAAALHARLGRARTARAALASAVAERDVRLDTADRATGRVVRVESVK